MERMLDRNFLKLKTGRGELSLQRELDQAAYQIALQTATLEESRIVTWKNRFYRYKGKLWEQRMLAQGWSPLAARVRRRLSDRRVINDLACHYIKDKSDRVPFEKYPRRFGER
jgi:hypothetical protein